MNEQNYFATTRYKIFVVTYTAGSWIIALASLYFMAHGFVQWYVALIFFAIRCSMTVRAINVFRNPEIIFDDELVGIRGWFGGMKKFDPFSAMEVAPLLVEEKLAEAYIINQNNNAYSFASNAIGKEQFSSLISKIVEVGKNSKKTMFLMQKDAQKI
jgi:hypothetical protein